MCRNVDQAYKNQNGTENFCLFSRVHPTRQDSSIRTRRSLGPQLVLLLQRSVAFRKQWSPSRRSDHLKKTSSRAALVAAFGRWGGIRYSSTRVRVHTCQSHRLWSSHLLFPTSIDSLFSDPAAHATPARRPPPSRLGTELTHSPPRQGPRRARPPRAGAAS